MNSPFDRKAVVKPSHVGGKGVVSVESKRGTNVVNDDGEDSNLVLELQSAGTNDFPLAILGCYKDFRSMANTLTLCRSEGFIDVDIKYLGGLWILFYFNSMEVRDKFLNNEGISQWFASLKPWHDDFLVEERLVWLEIEGVPIRAWDNVTFKSICNKWGELLFSDDSDTCNRLSKRLCIKSTYSQLIFATTFVTLNKVTYAIRVRELCSWTPSFVREDSDSDDENSLSKFNHEKEEEHEVNDVESVADTDFGNAHFKVDEDTAHVLNNSKLEHVEPQVVDIVDSDPFGLEPLINKKRNMDRDVKGSETPEFPPGFSPSKNNEQPVASEFPSGSPFSVHDIPLDGKLDQSRISDSVSHGTSQKLVGFSLIERIEETIKVRMALGLNMDGCRSTLAALIANNGEFKETKMVRVDQWMLRQVWGNYQFDFVSMSARGLWIPNNINIMWIVVYVPQTLSSKIAVWDAFANIILNWNGILVAMGDFNEVKEATERFGSSFNARQADIFNSFISNTSLIDVPLGGYKFMWIDKWGSKMSKLDRFLVSESLYETFPHITGVILEKGVPDYRPILIKEHVSDFGSTPFHFIHSWLQLEGFHSLVVDTWSNDVIVDANGFNSFKRKLQNLKRIVRVWTARYRSDVINLKKEHLSRLTSIDIKIDQGIANETDLSDRRDSIYILEDLDKREISDIAQKARVKWAMERDENSQFFHATLKKNRRQIAIKGIQKNGDWIVDPDCIKDEFRSHFLTRFQAPTGFPSTYVADMINCLSSEQATFLERSITNDEIKKAAWDCGGDRALGPDGFTFKFFTTFWDLIEGDVIRFVQEFFGTPVIPKGYNSSFIALILKVSNVTLVTDFWPISLIGCRNILDGPLVLNEVMAWHRSRKKQLMIFKVDFEKEFDSLKWDFLDLVMEKLGFDIRWRSWIKGCLHNARASVLVNGSPTNEFEIFRGLGQGDPLSPFLFILAMEGLHAFICKAINTGMYKGISIGNNLHISHLMYADDVIFIGDWSLHNASNLICILCCFFLVSGLKINVNKSKISGICISNVEIMVMANVIGCGAANFPFKYLGVPVGCNMARCSNWDPVIQKFSTRLSHWKARLLSVGGRLTLIKFVLGSLPLYFMSLYKVPISVCNKLESMHNQFFLGSDLGEKKMTWVSWKKCLDSKKSGGLGIGSIYGLNVGLLFKWIWRFLQNAPDLWINIIKAIYGQHGGLFNGLTHRSSLSPWCGILSSIKSLKLKGIDLLALCIQKLRNGVSIRNCNVANRVSLLDWSQFLRRTPRGGIEATQFVDLKCRIGDVTLSDHNDAWNWSPNTTKGFSVASARKSFWEVDVLNGLNSSSRVNLDRRGIDIPSILCPNCQEDVETVNHIFSHARWLLPCGLC
ncbi:putative RNA-directed DNA polymerase, eukaryota, reverse transcriptase zinc-binding domain protein [Tanacetum coccineum]